MAINDFNNGLILGLSLQGTLFIDKKSAEGGFIFEPIMFSPKFYQPITLMVEWENVTYMEV